ncbi:protein phosphatase CheZ [Herbaspirillum sp. WKF16]|uniref:protein phosphatase CheZ n=2 Tax=Herbaspirillum sp. WKF16 TaxID=3028312 RepID=UPI0023A93AAC|nr:protein phosphatase CheZ [Herbaspirillum sp. WKF16]WDZ98010.1 protein phosphatase CheZ [Herbaspirillum sp. WKF16]
MADMDASVKPVQADEGGAMSDVVLARIGHMTRNLHDSLRGLGFDRLLERAASDMPDARDRLEYVARMTEQAAQRVLTATELASPLQERIGDGAAELKAQWDAAGAGSFSEADYRALGARTSAFLAQVGQDSSVTKQQLLDIMMAQDFQDLTGQVIKRVTQLAHELESQLVQLLVDYSPGDLKREDTGLLNGPQIDPAGKDVIANQGQVDDLLESLGF